MAERASLFPANNSGAAGPVTALDARYGLAAGYQGTGLVTARSGFRPSAAAPGLVTATTPTANKFIHVAAFQHVQQSLRGGGVYVQTNDATIDINVIDTYPPDATNSRRDLVIIHQQDIGFAEADSQMRVRYVTGTPGSGSDPSLAAYPEYRTLARVIVPPSATVINPGDITDLRNSDSVLYTVATGGILPIGSVGERAAIVAPYEGMAIYRTDRDWVEIYDGTAWRVKDVAVCSSTADRDSAITNPYSGQLAQIINSGDPLYQYDGSTSSWVLIAIAPIYCHVYQLTGATQNIANLTPTAITFTAEVIDTNGFHSTTVNTSRIIPTIPGRYRARGMVAYTGACAGMFNAQIRKNGAALLGATPYESKQAINQAFLANTCSAPEATVSCNGTTDYLELWTNHQFGATTPTFANGTDQQSYLLVEYMGPN